MLISCKCSNFIATSNSTSNATSIAADAPPPSVTLQGASGGYDSGMSSIANNGNAGNNNTLSAALMHAFLQKYPRNFIFYSQCMDLFKQSIGPIPDLTINAINQRELVYSLTLDVAYAQCMQSWQISICINCNSALCAKRLPSAGAGAPPLNPPQYLINCSLLTNNEEIAHRRADKSFSDTFGLLIMDHPHLAAASASAPTLQNGATTPTGNLSSISLSSTASGTALDAKQQRQRQLQQHLQQRLKREIAETDECIQRHADKQFALLKSFREKSEQECDLLLRLLQRIPEQQIGELLDSAPPALDVNAVASYAARRRNTIGSRRDINSSTAPTTPTTPNPTTTANMLQLPMVAMTAAAAGNAAATSAMDTSTTGGAIAVTSTNTQGTAVGGATTNATTTVLAATNRKMSNFDTPPATPEATPMSVGNSPTFRQQQQLQQQQQQQLQQQPPHSFVGRLVHTTQSFQQQFPTPTVESGDDCLFELEGIDGGYAAPAPAPAVQFTGIMPAFSLKLPQHHAMMQQQSAQQQHLQRNLSNHHDNNMSDLDESDDAEEAEDALDMDSSTPIPAAGSSGKRPITSEMLNFAKSLPIEITNSPMVERSYIGDSDDDELDSTLDIAASIKALAKSVHGETVFGDLPRPRLRSQI